MKDNNLDYIPDLIKRTEKKRWYCSWQMLEKYDQDLKEYSRLLDMGIYFLPRF